MMFPADRIFNHNIVADPAGNPNLGRFLIIFLLPIPAASQPPSPPATDSSTPNSTTSADLSTSVGILLIGVLAVVLLTSFLSFSIRHCTGDSGSDSGGSFVVALPGDQSRGEHPGLDAAVIDGFPTVDYSAVKALKIGNAAHECAICISMFQDDETLRLMPNCDHFFHSSCIDTWLASHPTCPVCRTSLVARSNESIHGCNLDQVRGSDQVQEDR